MTVTFGLFHGLVLLPVMLAIAGPLDKEEESTSQNKEHEHPMKQIQNKKDNNELQDALS